MQRLSDAWPAAFLMLCALPAFCQQESGGSAPLYRITVIERSVDAVNYQYRSGPTRVDFRGTVLLPKAKGEATVESRRGRTEIRAKLEGLEPPTRFGREYLTYVLWAVSPEGAPHNLGELVADGSNDAKISVTTGLQAFGLIVTAEPYSAVRQPSDVVVAENAVRADTVGRIQPIRVKYELMPRGHYTWDKQRADGAPKDAPKVSMDRYEALLHLYQAQNAVGIAQSAGAERYAPNTFSRARAALAEASRLNSLKGNERLTVQSAREAAQLAEDSRLIAERKRQEETLAEARQKAADAEQARIRAESEAQRAQAEAAAANERAAAERAARLRNEATAATPPAPSMSPTNADRVAQSPADERAATQRNTRLTLFERLNGALATRDTPRGLVVTLPDSAFSGASLQPGVGRDVARLAATLREYAGLRVEVEGHSDLDSTAGLAAQRAQSVRDALAASGFTSAIARNLGASRPTTSNTSAEGRTENRRVEVVISGQPVGEIPFWDRTYSVTARD